MLPSSGDRPSVFTEFYAFREISAYLRHVEIPLARASGPYYLTECYQLYRVEGMDPSPDMLAMVAEAYDRPDLSCAAGAVSAPPEAGTA